MVSTTGDTELDNISCELLGVVAGINYVLLSWFGRKDSNVVKRTKQNKTTLNQI